MIRGTSFLTLLMVLFTLIILESASGTDLANGFYAAASEDSSAKALKFKIKRATLISQDNLNKYFQLTITVPFDSPQYESVLFVIEESRFKTSSSGSSEGVERDYNFQIPQDAVVSVEKFLKIKAEYRKHPGHRIHAALIPSKKDYKPGEDVILKLVVSNLGSASIAFQVGGRNRSARDNQFSFSLFCDQKAVLDIGNPVHFGGLSQRRILRPGEKFEIEVSLGKWFKFDKEGFCEGIGSYYFAMNPVSGNNAYRILWEDYATAPFYFRIKK